MLIIMQNLCTFTLSILESLKEMCIWLYLIDVFLDFLYLPIFNLWTKIDIHPNTPPPPPLNTTQYLFQTLNWHVLLALYFPTLANSKA